MDALYSAFSFDPPETFAVSLSIARVLTCIDKVHLHHFPFPSQYIYICIQGQKKAHA